MENENTDQTDNKPQELTPDEIEARQERFEQQMSENKARARIFAANNFTDLQGLLSIELNSLSACDKDGKLLSQITTSRAEKLRHLAEASEICERLSRA